MTGTILASSEFQLVGVIARRHAGVDIGETLGQGTARVPIVASLEEERNEDMIELSAELQQLLQKRVVCFFATIMPDGSPHVTQTWVDTDGTYILINTVEGHQKLRNVRRDPRVMISVVDPAHWERALSIRGRVVEITKERADLQFKQLIQRNLGHEEYRYGRPGQVRTLLKITPEKILSSKVQF